MFGDPCLSVHAKLEEKITLVANRDGGLENMDISGMLSLRISDKEVRESFSKLQQFSL